ncbi:hypothetical protein A2J03_24225 [Rhodococcus sp. EPR-157]|uniref:WXG100 family type VII secretion target n=1 Tax=Rhodococcus sp. EPR-157 TaxID=1813677 RepID=UPI0007BC1CCF|nr:hypothetical protein [Rhodococcus sp. EPR-157]KZF06610.1 hypothetical protein A2J03_24225 [Rhodococcus sp. EPR-157]
MPPTKLDVDPGTYYAAANVCFRVASALCDAARSAGDALSECGGMAGTYDEGAQWAVFYDEYAADFYTGVNALVEALENYGDVLTQAGYNYAVAEQVASQSSIAPEMPALPDYIETSLLGPPPAAGGPGVGLLDDGLGLVGEVGIPVPDGDTVKLGIAAGVWRVLATGNGMTNLPMDLESAAALFADTVGPDVEFVDEDLHELSEATADLIVAANELSAACAEYRTSLVDLRDDLERILVSLAQELAVTAAISIAAACITFGAGAVAGIAASTRAVVKYGVIVRDAIVLWRSAKGVGAKLMFGKDLKRLRSNLQRIRDLGRRTKPTQAGPPPSVPAGWVNSPARNGRGEVWQKPGSTGNNDSMRIMDPSARYPNGYVRYYNEHGQPIDLNGKPGPQSSTHIPIEPDGSFAVPKGW